MDDFNKRAFTALGLSVFALIVAYSLKMLSGLPLLSKLLPLLVGMGGWWLLYHWRLQDGREKSGPIYQYAMIVVGAYLLFGLLFPPAAQAQPIASAIAIALLLPAVGEYVRDHSKFKPEPDEPSDHEPYRPTLPQTGGLNYKIQ
ncbi:MAG: hypothetical protein KGH63_04800 [Candidatus Micrarchaeota archaeon]|nr:hypothetical protein [Candidatus Micrarchaeota archaeon]